MSSFENQEDTSAKVSEVTGSNVSSEDHTNRLLDLPVNVKNKVDEVVDNANFIEATVSNGIEGELKDVLLNKSFKVPSEGWEEFKFYGVPCKMNGEKDIVEFIEGDLEGEQLFSYRGAKRETANIGARVIEFYELESILAKLDDPKDSLDNIVSKTDLDNIKYTGGFFKGSGYSSFMDTEVMKDYASCTLLSLLESKHLIGSLRKSHSGFTRSEGNFDTFYSIMCIKDK